MRALVEHQARTDWFGASKPTRQAVGELLQSEGEDAHESEQCCLARLQACRQSSRLPDCAASTACDAFDWHVGLQLQQALHVTASAPASTNPTRSIRC